ncbi:protein kinase domain-containing protein [Bacillus alveayuensis]|uniref:protein kinase domain-containing protein n=1 Tax=Aeribacillus alveayuensis TaxID=279215 RepID=UPI000A0642EF|nr:serine/threonine-protein kinase [Bacillus alveayuensis]
MMNNLLKNHLCKLPPGYIIVGKWHKHSYKIIKLLGNGANGVVYLAESSKGLVAVKLSDNSMAITSEVNVLKHFSKVQGVALGPSLLDVDDWFDPYSNKIICFYVMEYIKGEGFLSFIQKKGKEWIIILILQLLSDLEKLHQEGWVFGDLKPENLLVVGQAPKIRLLDVGGTTLKGRAIKEFTEFYDRGYWGMGSRKAEPSYDLFSVAMIMINACYLKRFEKQGNGREQLMKMIVADETLRKYRKVLMSAIDGKYKYAREMHYELMAAVMNGPSRMTTKNVSKKIQKSKKRSSVLETALIFMIIFFMYVIYLYIELL